MIYSFKPGSHISGVDPETVGRVCEELSAQGNLTAAGIVEISEPEDAPLHKCFEWDDSKAAREYRLEQGRSLIRCIMIQSEPEQAPVRAYFNIEQASPIYKPITLILSSQDDTQKLFQTAMRELQAFRCKYSQLQQFAKVFDAIDQLGNDT